MEDGKKKIVVFDTLVFGSASSPTLWGIEESGFLFSAHVFSSEIEEGVHFSPVEFGVFPNASQLKVCCFGPGDLSLAM